MKPPTNKKAASWSASVWVPEPVPALVPVILQSNKRPGSVWVIPPRPEKTN